MKKTVTVVVIVFLLFMGSVFVYGFVRKQQAENNAQNNATPSQSQPSDSSGQPQDSSSSSSVNSTQSVTTSAVSSHNKPSNCWIIIHGNAYNVTNFLDQHPGGSDAIIPYCGRDATTAFDTQGGRRRGHSQTAQQLLQDYLIGPVQ